MDTTENREVVEPAAVKTVQELSAEKTSVESKLATPPPSPDTSEVKEEKVIHTTSVSGGAISEGGHAAQKHDDTVEKENASVLTTAGNFLNDLAEKVVEGSTSLIMDAEKEAERLVEDVIEKMPFTKAEPGPLVKEEPQPPLPKSPPPVPPKSKTMEVKRPSEEDVLEAPVQKFNVAPMMQAEKETKEEKFADLKEHVSEPEKPKQEEKDEKEEVVEKIIDIVKEAVSKDSGEKEEQEAETVQSITHLKEPKEELPELDVKIGSEKHHELEKIPVPSASPTSETVIKPATPSAVTEEKLPEHSKPEMGEHVLEPKAFKQILESAVIAEKTEEPVAGELEKALSAAREAMEKAKDRILDIPEIAHVRQLVSEEVSRLSEPESKLPEGGIKDVGTKGTIPSPLQKEEVFQKTIIPAIPDETTQQTTVESKIEETPKQEQMVMEKKMNLVTIPMGPTETREVEGSAAVPTHISKQIEEQQPPQKLVVEAKQAPDAGSEEKKMDTEHASKILMKGVEDVEEKVEEVILKQEFRMLGKKTGSEQTEYVAEAGAVPAVAKITRDLSEESSPIVQPHPIYPTVALKEAQMHERTEVVAKPSEPVGIVRTDKPTPELAAKPLESVGIVRPTLEPPKTPVAEMLKPTQEPEKEITKPQPSVISEKPSPEVTKTVPKDEPISQPAKPHETQILKPAKEPEKQAEKPQPPVRREKKGLVAPTEIPSEAKPVLQPTKVPEAKSVEPAKEPEKQAEKPQPSVASAKTGSEVKEEGTTSKEGENVTPEVRQPVKRRCVLL